MELWFFVIMVYLGLYSLMFLAIGFRAIIIRKPTIFNSKIRLVLIAFAFLSLLVLNIKNLNFIIFKLNIDLIFPIFIVLYLVYYFFMLKGYTIYCVDDNDFRASIIDSLNTNGIKYVEKINAIELIELNNIINIAYAAWTGSGVIKLKNRKDGKIFKKIINDIKKYYRENNIKTGKKLGVFLLLFGLLYIAITIICAYYIFIYR